MIETADYSVWLTPERLELEEKQWAEVRIYELYASHLMRVVVEERCKSVLEIGCGTGWVPTRLPESLEYVGVDANDGCLALAAQKNPTRSFLAGDVRSLSWHRSDLVCSFAVLKHFALSEWSEVLAKVLSFGRVGLFTMNVGPSNMDDFEQGFPHTWVSRETLARAVWDAGHRMVSAEPMDTTETMVCTCTR